MGYPNIFERRPGELWITTGWRPRPALGLRLREQDFIGPKVEKGS